MFSELAEVICSANGFSMDNVHEFLQHPKVISICVFIKLAERSARDYGLEVVMREDPISRWLDLQRQRVQLLLKIRVNYVFKSKITPILLHGRIMQLHQLMQRIFLSDDAYAT